MLVHAHAALMKIAVAQTLNATLSDPISWSKSRNERFKTTHQFTTAMAEEGKKKLHIVMFPWLAFGHMIPYLELAKLIAQKGHLVSYVSTPRNIDRLPKLPPYLSPLLKFVKLPLPEPNTLPENAEATSDVPYDKVQHLFKAMDGLQEPMITLLETLNPDWVLHDFAPYWLGPMAAKQGIKSVFFTISIPASLAFLRPPSILEGKDDRTKPEHWTVPSKWVSFPTTVAFRYFEIMKIYDNMDEDVSGVSAMTRVGKCIRSCDMVATRSCDEFDGEWLQLLIHFYQKPVFPLGQLPTTDHDDDVSNPTWISIKSWLEKQSKGSVVYIAFGSETKPTQDELTEIAFGLELSKLPFFWVLRTRRGLADTEVLELPEGFEDRTKDRGMVCTSWAPQLKILAHDSVGGTLIHSGWSSVVEAIQFERALILLAFISDQGLNNRLLEEKKIGYSIPRNERDGSFTRESVAASLRLVMVDEEGKIYRDKAMEMKTIFVNRERQDQYVDNLVDYLQIN